MTAGLLERDAELRRLRETLRGAGQGRGSVVLVSGEAGIGKTSLVRAFAREAAGRARVLAGACDDLVTPRTLGPFRDMAREAAPALARAMEPGAARDAVFGAVHQELAGGPVVLLVEDVHWADDATLDVLRYLAWRIPELPAVLVLTYREDELGGQHPLRRVLAALPHGEVRRLHLRPLSAGAVAELAGGHGADAAAVLAATAGNPFFVTEVLANPGVRGAGHRPRRRPGPAGGPQRPGPPGAGAAGRRARQGRAVAGRGAARRSAGGPRRGRAAGHAGGRPRARLVPPRAGPPGDRAPA